MMSHPEISVREAIISDLDLVFLWANDALVRSQSFNSEPIDYKDHVTWFRKKIASKTDLLLIVTVNDLPAGLVRIENIVQKAVIGIVVDAKFRGKGLAYLFLTEAVGRYFTVFRNPIFAYIKKTNIASIQAFKKAGFELLEEDQVSGHPSLVLILKDNTDK